MRKFCFVVFLSVLSLTAYASSPLRVVYWKASDVRSPGKDELDSAVNAMSIVQDYFASEMERHGFGRKTFAFDPDIVVIESNLKRSQSDGTAIHRGIPFVEWGFQNDVYVVFIGGAAGGVTEGSVAYMKPLCLLPVATRDCNSLVVVPAENHQLLEVLLAHEIAHAFGLLHHAPTRLIGGRVDLMYKPLHVHPHIKEHVKNYVFSRKDAMFLNEDGRLFEQKTGQVGDRDIQPDVNKDGYVDLSDVMIVRSGMRYPSKYDTDVNNDGVTDEVDVLIVKAKAVEAIAAAAPSLHRKRKLTGIWADLKR